MSENSINIYWTTTTGLWSTKNPIPAIDILTKNKIKRHDKEIDQNSIYSCPAFRNYFNNIFSIKSAISDKCEWPDNYLKNIYDKLEKEEKDTLIRLENFYNLLPFHARNKPSIPDYLLIGYKIGLIFFSDESLEAKFFAPNFPPKSPCENALLATGTYNIGEWFRPFNLEYFIPNVSKIFNIKENDDLFYIEFLTNKKLNFIKFNFTEDLKKICSRFSFSASIDGRKKSLEDRYDILKEIYPKEFILEEIKKNILT